MCDRPEQPNVELWTQAYARRLMTDPSGEKFTAVEVRT